MSGVYLKGFPGRKVNDHHPGRNKLLLLIKRTQPVVNSFQYFFHRNARSGYLPDQGFGLHHEKRRRDSLPGHVRDHKGKVVLVDREKVVQVTAHFLGRRHGSIQLEPGIP